MTPEKIVPRKDFCEHPKFCEYFRGKTYFVWDYDDIYDKFVVVPGYVFSRGELLGKIPAPTISEMMAMLGSDEVYLIVQHSEGVRVEMGDVWYGYEFQSDENSGDQQRNEDAWACLIISREETKKRRAGNCV